MKFKSSLAKTHWPVEGHLIPELSLNSLFENMANKIAYKIADQNVTKYYMINIKT